MLFGIGDLPNANALQALQSLKPYSQNPRTPQTPSCTPKRPLHPSLRRSERERLGAGHRRLQQHGRADLQSHPQGKALRPKFSATSNLRPEALKGATLSREALPMDPKLYRRLEG